MTGKQITGQLLDEAVIELFPKSAEARRLKKIPRPPVCSVAKTRGWRKPGKAMRRFIGRGNGGSCPSSTLVTLLCPYEGKLLVMFVWPEGILGQCQIGSKLIDREELRAAAHEHP